MRCTLWALLAPMCLALYEDQAGVNDWHVRNVGSAQRVVFHGSLAVVGSARGIVAAIGADGALAWRESLPESDEGREGGLAWVGATKNRALTLSKNGCHLRCWLAKSGGMAWDRSFCESELGHDAENVDAVIVQGHVIVARKNTASVVDASNGELVWNHEVNGADIIAVANEGENAWVVGVEMNALVVWEMDVKKKVVRESWKVDRGQGVREVVSAGNALMWVANGELVVHKLDKRVTKVVKEARRVAQVGADKQGRFVEVDGGVYQINEEGNALEAVSEIGKESVSGAAFAPEGKTAGSLVVMYQSGSREGKSCGPVEKVSWHPFPGDQVYSLEFPEPSARAGERGAVKEVFVQSAYVKSEGASSARILVRFQDESLVAIQYRLPSPGAQVESQLLYVREEALSDVIMTSSVELPPAVGQGDIDEEMAEHVTNVFSHSNTFSVFLFRLKDQLRAVKSFFLSLGAKALHYIDAIVSSQGMFLVQAYQGNLPKGEQGYSESALQAFGFRKGILVLTGCGKFFLLNSLDGSIITSGFDPSYASNTKMFVTRAHSAGVSHPAEVIFLNTETGKASWRNALTGSLLREETVSSTLIETVVVSPETYVHHLSPSGVTAGKKLEEEEVSPAGFVIAIDKGFKWHTFPSDKKAWLIEESSLLKKVHAVHYDASTRTLMGLGLATSGLASVSWTVVVPGSDEVLQIKTNAGGHVNNPGIARGDGSVLVKYINPNLLFLATQNTQGDLIATVMDGVSGRIHKRFTHKLCTGPVRAVLFDNTVVYTFWNDASKRNEIAVAALFEGVVGKRDLNMWTPREESDVGGKKSFSSYDAESPNVMQRTFFTAEGIRALGVTETRFGIADRRVLMGLEMGSLNLQVRQFLDARRPTSKPSETEAMEGLVPYSPQLPIIAGFTLSYNLTVERMNNIYSFPSKLESTTLVVATGLDIFFTRVMPSKGFDVLNEDFSFSLLILLTSGLVVAAVVLKGMVNERQLSTSWA